MPTQTVQKNFLFPDGAQVLIKEDGASTYTDVGAINSSITNSVTYDENQVETANAGTTEKQINNMKVEGAMTLINWDMSVFEKLSGGLITRTVTAASATTDIPDQTFTAGEWAGSAMYDLIAKTSATDDTELKITAQPTLTSVTLDPDSTAEVLVEGTDYFVIANANSSSGWSIGFIPGNMGTVSPLTYDIDVVYGSNIPVASETLNAGASTVILTASALRIKHTDENGKVRQLDLHSVDQQSGSFSFNFKGANEDGLEELPFSYMAKIDSSKTSGQQLFSFLYETGAQ